jgi:hypothetical protein
VEKGREIKRARERERERESEFRSVFFYFLHVSLSSLMFSKRNFWMYTFFMFFLLKEFYWVL